MEKTPDAGVGPAIGDAGPCPTVTYLGKTYQLGHPTQRAKAALELLVIEVAQKNIDDAKPVIGAKKHEAKCAALDDDVIAGAYRTGGTLWSKLNNGPYGQALFLTSLLRERHPDLSFDVGLAIWRNEPRQVQRGLAVVIPDFFALLAADLPMLPADRETWLVERIAEFSTALEALTPAASTE
jgi:hypothetical protein